MGFKLSDLGAALQAKWETITDYADVEHRHMGGRGVVLSGAMLRTNTIKQVIGELEAVLPKDAAIWELDGQVFRTPIGPSGYARDATAVLFLSGEWPMVPEGGYFPEYTIRMHSDVLLPVEYKGEVPEGVTLLHRTGHLINSVHTVHEFVIDKRTHVVEIPRVLETEHTVTIVVTPRH
jgi:hypothetical protein